MKIAVEGCAHGELDRIYETIEHLEKINNIKVDLLIICGDFQAVRNPADLNCMAVPPKYRKLNTFYKYYSGTKKAPILTIFIGGNHEASNYLSELPYGGWVCPNIYYLGYANVINVGGVRIAGLSGIYKGRDYLKGHFECPPYDESSKKSVYHVRNLDVFRLKQLKKPIDIFISHDWPTGIYNFGNKNELLRRKPFFKDEMENNSLGSQPAHELLMKLKPSYWFAAHLHCKFAAIVPHDDNGNKTFTKFLALDKCLPRRKFLQLFNIGSPISNPLEINYDPEWLSILHSTNHLLSVSRRNNFMPGYGCGERWDFSPTEDDINSVCKLFDGQLNVLNNFTITAPTYNPSERVSNGMKFKAYMNPQTEKFCRILNITDPLVKALSISGESLNVSESLNASIDTSQSTFVSLNPDEIQLSDEDSSDAVPLTSNSDLDTSARGEFFIDKVGLNMSQNISTPGMVDPNLRFPEIKEENLVQQEERCDGNPVKKFKRRNLSLYNSENDS